MTPPLWPFSLFVLLAQAGCTRSSLGFFVPALELRAGLTRRARIARLDEGERLDAQALALLSWQPRRLHALSAASEPSPDPWLAPCEPDDAACLAEAAELEDELARVVEDLAGQGE